MSSGWVYMLVNAAGVVGAAWDGWLTVYEATQMGQQAGVKGPPID